MKAVVTILKATSAVTDLLANGADSVYSDIAVQSDAAPFIIVDTTEQEGNPTMGGTSTRDEYVVQVYCHAKRKFTNGSEVGAWDIAQQVRTALDYNSGTYAGQIIKHISWEGQTTYPLESPNQKRREVEQTYRVVELRS